MGWFGGMRKMRKAVACAKLRRRLEQGAQDELTVSDVKEACERQFPPQGRSIDDPADMPIPKMGEDAIDWSRYGDPCRAAQD